MAQIGKLTGARVVRTPQASHPYKVVLEGERGLLAEHPVTSVREGEALIRAHRPRVLLPETLADLPRRALRLVAGGRD